MKSTIRLLAVLFLLFRVSPAAGAVQLRPFGPLDWEVLEAERPISVGIGFGYISDQQASLAGTRGDLVELGNFKVAWRSGRVGVEITGTMARRFKDQTIVRAPILGTNPPNGQIRRDAGDVLASTLVRLTDQEQPVLLALRFGTRLPTTSDEPGLDRDRTDFFTTFGARYNLGSFAFGGEGGLAILGTRLDNVDQLDVLTYSLGVEWRWKALVSSGLIIGQDDMHSRVVRGNEDLSELRFGIKAGKRIWVSASAIKGLADFSPGNGWLLMVGMRR